ncbi:MAG TPA: tetratricopeptide repeat protein [Planctomycetota bacterium]|nr:tetratricopeptide repeat protein [Planctomycetota bacterium]
MQTTSTLRAPRALPCRAAVASLVLSAACSDHGASTGPTFAGDVASLVYSSCTPCHRPGGPTPFSLLGYDDVYKRRQKIVEVTGARLMPPWLPSHGEFLGDRRLAGESITMLRQWVEAGAPRGDVATEPKCPDFPEGWQLREPDLVVTVAQDVVVPPSGPDLFRNYVIPVQLDGVRFVEAVEIRPGSAAVHHAVLVVDETREARRRDALDAEPGFPGMDLGNARPPDGHFLGWTPGKRARRGRDGTAWRLSPGCDLVLQLHLTPTGKRETLRPRIGLYFTDVPPRAVFYPLTLFSQDIDMAAGDSDYVVRDHLVIPVPVAVDSIYPHAHYLCRQMVASVTPPGGASRELLRIDRWDFDWQDDYTFREPVPLPAGTRIEFEYHYDNSAANPSNPSSPPRRVRLGQESTDEMATLGLQVSTADLDARRRLGEACVRRDLEKLGYSAALLLELAGLLRETGRNDEALNAIARVREREPGNADALRELGACLEVAGRAEEAERAYGECLGRDPGQNVARVQLANILTRTGRAASAIPLYEKAIELNPTQAALHNNLATACLAQGLIDEAERHYRRTLELDPGFFRAWFNLGRVLAATGRKDDARTALLRARALQPGDANVAAALRELGN